MNLHDDNNDNVCVCVLGGGGLVVMTITLGVRGCGAEPGTVLMLMCVIYC